MKIEYFGETKKANQLKAGDVFMGMSNNTLFMMSDQKNEDGYFTIIDLETGHLMLAEYDALVRVIEATMKVRTF